MPAMQEIEAKSSQSGRLENEHVPEFTFNSLFKHLKASIFVWFVLIFLLLDGAAQIQWGQHSKTPYTDKLVNFFKSDKRADIILFGSSVAFASAFTSDESLGLTGKTEKWNYLGAEDLTRKIKAASGKQYDIVNLACFGAMANHACLVAEKLVEFKRAPEVFIYETASRDLFDASMPRSFESDYHRALASMHPKQNGNLPAPITQLIDWLATSAPGCLIQNLTDDPQSLSNPDRLRFELDSLLGSLSCIYHERLSILATLTDQAMKFSGRQGSAKNSSEQNEIANKRKNPFATLSSSAPSTFIVDSSPQMGRYDDEMIYFLRLVKVCKDNHIKLVVVSMPVTPAYDALVPVDLLKRWRMDIGAAAKKGGAIFLDMDDRNVYASNDFIDTVHLNAKGSLKLNELLAKELEKSGALKNP